MAKFLVEMYTKTKKHCIFELLKIQTKTTLTVFQYLIKWLVHLLYYLKV